MHHTVATREFKCRTNDGEKNKQQNQHNHTRTLFALSVMFCFFVAILFFKGMVIRLNEKNQLVNQSRFFFGYFSSSAAIGIGRRGGIWSREIMMSMHVAKDSGQSQ